MYKNYGKRLIDLIICILGLPFFIAKAKCIRCTSFGLCV